MTKLAINGKETAEIQVEETELLLHLEETFEQEIIDDDRLSEDAKGLGSYIALYLDQGIYPYPDHMKIAKYLTVHPDTIKPHMNELIDNGYILSENDYSGNVISLSELKARKVRDAL